METNSNYMKISNISFIMSIIILLSNTFAFFLKIDINSSTFFMSTLLGVLLLINGILYKKGKE